MDSQQFLDWLEEKLQAAGVEKVVPDAATLAAAYQYCTQVAQLQETLDAAMAAPVIPTEVPEHVPAQIRARITDDPTLSWDAALWAVVRARTDEDGGCR